MRGFLIRRLLSSLPTLVGITLVTFLLLELLPGREVALAGGGEEGIPSARRVELLRKSLHLDEPPLRRYGHWVAGLARGDLGRSVLDGREVRRVIAEAAGPTLLLNLTAILCAFGLAIPIGVAAARRKGSPLAGAGALALYLLYAFPSFAAAILLQRLVSVRWGLLPLQGVSSLDPGAPALRRAADLLAHLALPAICLGYGSLAYIARFTRANLLQTLSLRFLTAARGRGFGEGTLAWRHALRNTAIPLATLGGFMVPALLSGSILIETIFSWPGVGRLYFSSLQNRDFPVVLGLTILTAVLSLLGTLIADALYGLADPRVRPDSAGGAPGD